MPTPQNVDLGPGASNPNSISIPLKNTPRFKANKNKDKDEPCKAYKQMSKHWELPLALRGGTLEMREKREKWLPREPKESLAAYECRLKRTVCFEAFNRTVSTLAGLPFMRAITVENIPEELSYLETDCDGMGRDLTSFAHALLKETLELGLTHIYVDMPYFEGELSLAQVEEYKIRPYFAHLSPENLISWSIRRVGGISVLDSISIKEEYEEYDDDGEEIEIEQVRKVFADKIELWREVEDTEEWYLYDVLPNNLGKIPLITLYGNYTGMLQGLPPLEGLAWLNLKHYQKQSDVDNIEHVANVPILFGSGFDPAEMEGVEIGPNRLIIGPEGATLEYVEHSGQATGGSRESLKALEEQMAAMGADLIVRKSVDRQTATARAIDQSESISMLQIMINNLESSLEQAIKIAGEWVNIEVSDELQIDIGDYLDTEGAPNLIDIMTQMLIQNQGMSIEDVQKELKRRGVLSDVFKLGKREELVSSTTPQTTNGQLNDQQQTPAGQGNEIQP